MNEYICPDCGSPPQRPGLTFYSTSPQADPVDCRNACHAPEFPLLQLVTEYPTP